VILPRSESCDLARSRDTTKARNLEKGVGGAIAPRSKIAALVDMPARGKTTSPDDHVVQQRGAEWTAPALADHNPIRCGIT
jgi:hypothetical protein